MTASDRITAEIAAKELGAAEKGSSGWWHCKCPCHCDGRASLALRDTDDGRIAYKCMAGCDKAVVGAALEAKSLLPKKERKARTRDGKIVATYPYHDEDGVLLFEVVRFEPKDFRQRRPDGKGGWDWKLGDTRRVLYRLPELLTANPTEPVFVPEGEKDVDRLRALGLTATTSPQGAGKWSKTDRGALAGRHVVVLPDDDQPGRDHAAIIARDLDDKAASVRVLHLPGLPEKGDVSDWLAAGGTAEKLLELAAAAAAPAKEIAAAPAGDSAEPWQSKLHRTDRDEARDVLHNVVIILRQDERFAGHLRWNGLLRAAEGRDLPWHPGGGWREWTDADDLQLANWCQERRVYVKPRTTCAAAVQVAASDRTCHPVHERLDTLAWDGKPRLNRWLFDYLGATVEVRDGDVEEAHQKRIRYLEEVGRRWMISAVARVFKPGCKADHALILEGPQGALKSTAAATLALEPAWFADEIADLGTKDSAQDLRGKWIIELGELSAMRRGEVERVKAFLSRREDHYRPSYGPRSQDFPRQCVFIGTTNADTYLADETGGRRFWPVKVGAIKIDALSRDREQLWAEAVVAYRQGERWWLEREVEDAAREEQEERRIDDPWEQHVLAWLIDRSEASVELALQGAIDMPRERHDQRARNRIAAVFKAHKWARVQKRQPDGSRSWVYQRPETGDSSSHAGNSESLRTGAENGPRTGDRTPETGDTGDAKASDFNDVTSVTSVTSRARTRWLPEQCPKERHGEKRRCACELFGITQCYW